MLNIFEIIFIVNIDRCLSLWKFMDMSIHYPLYIIGLNSRRHGRSAQEFILMPHEDNPRDPHVRLPLGELRTVNKKLKFLQMICFILLGPKDLMDVTIPMPSKNWAIDDKMQSNV